MVFGCSGTINRMLSYAQRLRVALDAARIKQPALAKRTGLTTQAINKVLNEASGGFSVVNHFKVCRALGISALWLALGEGNMVEAASTPAVGEAVRAYTAPPSTAGNQADEQEVLSLFRQMRAEDQAWVLMTMRRFFSDTQEAGKPTISARVSASRRAA